MTELSLGCWTLLIYLRVCTMVAINPMRGKRNLKQLTFDFFNHYTVELEECDEVINMKRLTKWREKDAKD